MVLCAAFLFAYLPLINVQLGDFYFETAIAQVSFVVFIQISTLFILGAYSIIWRYVSINDLKVFVWAAVISGSILLALRFFLSHGAFTLWQVPISVIAIDSILGFGGLLGLRVLRRLLYEFREKNRTIGKRRKFRRVPVLLAGAGRTGATLAREIAGRSDVEIEIRGFIDDDPRKKGGSVSGFKVLGQNKDIPRIVHDLGIEKIVITPDGEISDNIRRIVDTCADLSIKTQIVPSLNELAKGKLTVSRIRDIQIEDLLGREPVLLDDRNLTQFLSEKTIMVTGAGGSIGSELVRQILKFSPAKILLIERSEFQLFEINREIGGLPGVLVVPFVADVGDEVRMRSIFASMEPTVIFHAAAHKHVPLMETNVIEAVKNNVFATKQLGELAGEYGATDFVLISTDKAVNPTSVMGASKRMAEIVVQDLNAAFETKYTAVRFGNVLGSAGSVVPIFSEQIRRGGPVTVTDPQMTRYFMTIPEASQLVLQAGALGKGGEIFILDMGEPVRILDLAEDMIRLSGLTPYNDIDIIFSGVRKGEKLFEELEISGERLEKTHHPKIYIGKIAEYPRNKVRQAIIDFSQAVEEQSEIRIRCLFNEILSESNLTEAAAVNSTDTPPNDKYFTQPAKLQLAEK